jgi:ribosome-binding factor A
LAELLRTELQDPRVGMANITAVEVSRDLSVAKVFVTFIGEQHAEQREEALSALNGAAGFLRGRLGGVIRMRTIPRLHFLFDVSGERSQRVAELIDLALASDSRKHAGND